jgi:MerR family transcriptional regulator, redox-sensitive transcriptional activator SoxR
MLIGEVARRAGLTTSALRYYEREGLLPPPARSAKRRVYDSQVIARIHIVQLARSAGFSRVAPAFPAQRPVRSSATTQAAAFRPRDGGR